LPQAGQRRIGQIAKIAGIPPQQAKTGLPGIPVARIAKNENHKPLKRGGTEEAEAWPPVRIGFSITRDHGDGGNHGDLLS
jgi:hypothetical protein